MDEVTRLRILEKYADLAKQEIESEERPQKGATKMNNDNLSIEDLDEEEKLQVKKAMDDGIKNIATQRKEKAQQSLLSEFNDEKKNVKAGSQEMRRLIEKYKGRGLDFGKIVF